MSDTVFALHQFVSHMKRGPKSVYEIVKKKLQKTTYTYVPNSRRKIICQNSAEKI